MTTQKRSTVVGVFEDGLQANQAVNELHLAGFRKGQIGVAMRHAEVVEDTADSGAWTGALTGVGLGAIAGVGVLAGGVPVLGPAIAVGTLGVILSNAAAGAGIVGLLSVLAGARLPEHEAQYYQDEFEAGRVIVTVRVVKRANEAASILRRNGAHDMSTQPVAQVAK